MCHYLNTLKTCSFLFRIPLYYDKVCNNTMNYKTCIQCNFLHSLDIVFKSYTTWKCPHFLFGQSSSSEVINTISETALSDLIECTHKILELWIKNLKYDSNSYYLALHNTVLYLVTNDFLP